MNSYTPGLTLSALLRTHARTISIELTQQFEDKPAGSILVLHPHSDVPAQWMIPAADADLVRVLALGVGQLAYCDPPGAEADVRSAMQGATQRPALALVPEVARLAAVACTSYALTRLPQILDVMPQLFV